MTWATCCDCGNEFQRDETERWKKRCFPCWKANKDREQREPEDADECLRWYRKGYAAGHAASEATRTLEPPPIDKARLRELLQLTHPDRHDGSELAQKVTAWLLDLRKRVTA